MQAGSIRGMAAGEGGGAYIGGLYFRSPLLIFGNASMHLFYTCSI